MMSKTQYALMFFVALCFFQGGFLTKTYIDHKYGPVAMVTPSELVNLMQERD